MLSLSTIMTLTFATFTLSNPVKKCNFPDENSIVSVSSNGWAMSPDEPCVAGKFCPYACPPGQLMNQWDPSSVSYSYPGSMNGGLICNSDGSVSKPFNNRPLCVDGKGTVSVENLLDSNVAFCQTVLPGNEAMLIPTNVESGSDSNLAVPGTEYWASTAAHYYINPPGVSTTDACTWGTSEKPIGNWAPYVAGMNMDEQGNTFVTIGVNPKHVDDFKDQEPEFGIRIICDDPNECVGLPCEIDPKNGYNKATGPSSGVSLNANFCIVTAKDHSKAKIELFRD